MISGGSGGDVQVTLVLAPSPVLTLALASAVAPPAWRPPVPSTSAARPDRKSTRLNSSHEWISYAVFCLKKKKERRSASRIAQLRRRKHPIARQRARPTRARATCRPASPSGHLHLSGRPAAPASSTGRRQ